MTDFSAVWAPSHALLSAPKKCSAASDRALGVPRVGDRPLTDERGDGADGLGLGGGERRGAEHQ